MSERLHRVDYSLASNGVYLKHSEYEVLKHTQCGVWIEMPWTVDGKKFVKSNTRKTFACKTEKEAIISFLARKEAQLKIMNNQMKNIRSAIRLAELEKRDE